MGKNLKELFEKDRLVDHKRNADHEDLFIERLYSDLPVKRKINFFSFKIAASILVFLGVGIISFFVLNSFEQQNDLTSNEFELSNISPEFNEIENFYITNINLELSIIEKNSKNKAIVKRYMKRLSLLKEEYKSLTSEMNIEGPNSLSIIALINNLKLQLELLQELNTQLIKSKEKEYEFI